MDNADFGFGDGREIDPAENHQMAVEQRKMLISAWHARNKLYHDLFGKYSYVVPANYAAPSEVVTETNYDLSERGDTGDPGDPELSDQHLAVLAYGPDPFRPYWTYVTAGLCSPWVQQAPDEVSGFGCELIIKAPVDATWPAQVLRSLAFYIFNHVGTMSPGTRIALNGPIVPASDSQLRNLFVWYADEAPDAWYQLPSGGFGLFNVIGITDDELKYADSVEEYGTWCIQEVLKRVGINQLSDPSRKSVTTRDDCEELMSKVKRLSDGFRTGGLAGMMDAQ
ncbi:MAG TPA: suppressor of fused domain protein [Oculatellaceae cyanobacterium]